MPKDQVEIIKNNGLVVLPTETVYGLGANAYSDQAIAKIFKVKGRPSNNPLIVHTYDPKKIATIAIIDSDRTKKRLEKISVLWPGPLSVVLKKNPLISNLVTANGDTVAVRIPAHKLALEFLELVNLPIAAPSANLSNSISPTKVENLAPEILKQVDLVIDGGQCSVGIESTVVDILIDKIKILRPGSITKEELESVLGEEVLQENIDLNSSVNFNKSLKSPGQLQKHYSPKTTLKFLEDATEADFKKQKIAIVTKDNTSFKHYSSKFPLVFALSLSDNLYEVAQNLFSTLAEVDKQNLELILIEKCPEYGIGIAIMDRLKRAVQPKNAG